MKLARGEDGSNKSLHGKNGEDFVLELPIGSIITNLETDENWQLTEEGQKILLLKGGYGGFGNEHFKSSTNTTPRESRPGQEGEQGNFKIELELFADIGLIGLPNAGKIFFTQFSDQRRCQSRGLCFYHSGSEFGRFLRLHHCRYSGDYRRSVRR